MSKLDTGIRWIVAQEGSRRSYAVPVAFHRLDLLRFLYVDIWCRGGSALLKGGPPALRALANRFHSEIPRDRVVSFSPSAITRKAAQHLRSGAIAREELGHFYCDYGEWFGSRVEKHLRSVDLEPDQDLFFGFDTNCLEVIEMLRKRKVTSIVAQVDPARVEEDLVLAEAERWPNWERTPGRMPQRYWDRLKAEWNAADLVGVNSEWSKEALIRQGVHSDKIFVVPIGIDLKKTKKAEDRGDRGGRALRVLWLGSVILRKGIQYLVEAARLLMNTGIEFLIAGEIGIAPRVVASFPSNMKMLGQLTRDKVAALYSEADVFVLPTLSDGFAVTQLEAMTHGLPVVITPNCGRVVTDGVDGFVIPPRNGEALAEALARFHHDRDLLREMSRQAQLSVRKFSLPENALAINSAVLAYRQRSMRHLQDPGGRSPSPNELPGRPAAQAVQGQPFPFTISNLEKPFRRPPKAVVCFAGSRDHYQLALALEEAGLLEKLVTDLYWKPNQVSFGPKIGRWFPKLLARHVRGISPDQVVTPAGAMLDRLLMNTTLASEDRQIRLDRALGRRARDEAWRSQSALFSYSYYAGAAFAPGRRQSPMRFLFQLHPHPAAVRKILQEEMVRVPKFAASLRWEHEIGAPETHFKSLCAESELANGWVVASSFTAGTLVDRGIPRSEIHVVPYGVDAKAYPCRDSAPRKGDPFRVIWVGSMTQRKGLSYFLEAVSSLPQQNLEILICGHHAVDRAVIEGYGIQSVRVLQGLPTEALTRLLRSCDLLALPSLVEGFAHVILEAMSSGLPVLTTPSTCAPDVLENGVHGFIVPIRDPGAIARNIMWGRSHRLELYQMGLAAATQASAFTWERFRKGIVKAYGQMVESRPLPAEAMTRN